MKKALIIYGAGNRGKNICQVLSDDDEYEIVGIVDGNDQIVDSKLLDRFEIKPVEWIKQIQQIPVCITIQNDIAIQSVRKMLSEEYKVDLKNEIFYERIMWEAFERKMQNLEIRLSNPRSIIIEAYMGLALGGIETWTKDLSKGLLNRGYQNVHILTDSKEYQLPQEVEKHVDIVERENTYNTEDTYKNFINLIDYYANSLPCTVIVNRYNVALMAACTLKKICPDGIRIISVIHTGTSENYRRYHLFEDYVDLYVGVSSDIKNGMLAKGVPSEKIETMTCPFSCDSVLERKYTTDDRMPICIGYAGRLEAVAPLGKRMDLLLALAEELSRRGVIFRISLAGDGPGRTEMECFSKRHGLENNFEFLGAVDHAKIHEFWKCQDICINLSDFEGRSLSVIEAMGNGVVPVVTMTSGVRDDIFEGVNGYIVPLGDYMGAADKIQYLAKHREMLEEMGNAAYKEVFPKSLLETHIDFWERMI